MFRYIIILDLINILASDWLTDKRDIDPYPTAATSNERHLLGYSGYLDNSHLDCGSLCLTLRYNSVSSFYVTIYARSKV